MFKGTNTRLGVSMEGSLGVASSSLWVVRYTRRLARGLFGASRESPIANFIGAWQPGEGESPGRGYARPGLSVGVPALGGAWGPAGNSFVSWPRHEPQGGML